MRPKARSNVMVFASRHWRRGSTSLVYGRLALVLCALFGPFTAWGQDQAFLSHQVWSTEQGLPQASVHQIFQSHDGYLWLATEGGVARFDGTGFKNYTHESDTAFTSDDVSSIAEAPRGILWFGTADGLIRRDGSSLHRFTQGDGLPSASVVSLATAGDGSLLVLTTAGLARVTESVVHPLPETSSVTAMEQGQDGSVWLMGSGQFLRYGAESSKPAALPGYTGVPVLGVQAAPGGSIWERTERTVELSAGALHRVLTAGQDLAGTRIQALLVDRDATAWIGTDRGLFTVTAQRSAPVRSMDALRSDSVLSIFQDREGNYWIGTEDSGLHVLRPRKFRAEAATVGDRVTTVVQASDGSLWAGTRDDGIRLVEEHQAQTPVPAAALTSPVVLSLAPGLTGDLWVGTPDGLNHISRGRVQRYTTADGMPDEFIRSLLVSHDGSVWLGTRSGLDCFAHGKFTTLTQAQGLPSNSIGPIYETATLSTTDGQPGSELWVGTAAGLVLYRNGTPRTFSTRDGLPGNVVTAITQDTGGTLWVAVHNAGLSRLHGGRFEHIAAPGIPLDITALAADPAGYLWLRSTRGVYRVNVQALARCRAGNSSCNAPVSQYGVADGMPSNELAADGSPSVWLTHAGELFFATRKGLAIAEPLHLPLNTVPPPVVLQRFAVDDVEEPLTGRELHISSGHRSFTFDYAGLSYTVPSKVRYRYKLEGFDRDWIDAGARRTAYYTSLPGRRYRFRVLAENNDGVWNETGASLSFSVQPPLFLRWWFYALLLLPVVLGAALISQLRLRAARNQFTLVLNERNRVAREIHDTLAQDLVSVSLQLELVAQMVRNSRLGEASQQIQETRTLVKKGIEAARQSIWNLRANAAQNSLPTRLNELTKPFVGRYAAAQVKIGGAYRALDEHTEGEVLRIAQESLANIDRHAAATEVSVELRYEADRLGLTVRDDGRGFSPEAARTLDGRYGLQGMKERAEALGGSLTITSSRGQGTTVALMLPLRAVQGIRNERANPDHGR